MKDIKLGDKVRDNVSGFEGITVGRTLFLNGCIQYVIAGKVGKEGKFPIEGDPNIDETNLTVIKKHVVKSCEYPEKIEIKKVNKRTGGPTTFSKGMKGY